MAREPIETADRETVRRRQAERLRETVRNAYENVPFYREAAIDHVVELFTEAVDAQT